MLIIGGLNAETETFYNDIYIFNINTNTWKKIDKKYGTTIS